MSRLYLPHTSGGLQLRAISSLYKCSQISRYHLLLSSKYCRVKRLAEEKLKWFARNKSLKFNPFDYLQKGTIVSTTLQTDKTILEMAKRLSWSDDIKVRESHACSLISQGSTLRLQDVNSYAIWSQTVLSLSDRVLSFSLNSIQDTLPHKVNLKRWHISDNSDCPLCGKYQTVQHVLNNCSKALVDKRYTWRHNSILSKLYNFILCHLCESWKKIVDLPDRDYIFPSAKATTSLLLTLYCGALTVNK